MPKFRVTASDVTFYRGVVEAENREALNEMDVEDMDLEEYDGEAKTVQTVEEIFPHPPYRCPSSHWNRGDDICEDCGTNLNGLDEEE
jgi:hypothetical protein